MRSGAAFFGTVEATLDAKSRSVVPADFREKLTHDEPAGMQSRFYMARQKYESAENIQYLLGYGHSLMRNMTDFLTDCSDSDAQQIETILALTSLVRFDDLGRFSMGVQLAGDLEFKEKILFRGMGEIFEIWHPASFEKVNTSELSVQRRIFRKVLAKRTDRPDS